MRRPLAFALVIAAAAIGLRADGPPATPTVRSTPENVVLGVFPIDRAPVARVPSGAVVRIDTLSQRGATQQEDPIVFLGKMGVKPEEVLQDVKDLWAARNAKAAAERGGGGHILTGPIYVEGAEPGDTLKVEFLDIATRVPYGINSTSSTGGVFAAGYPASIAPGAPIPVTDIPNTNHLIRTGLENGKAVAFFSDDIRVPMRPFFGTMAVAPDHPKIGDPGVRVDGVQASNPPGAYGGNMDFKELTVGATLYLPVFHSGALFYVGDPHGAQGDGEVSGNAIEQSLTGVFRFTVLKSKTISGPRAEDAEHYYLMGIDLDLNRAMRRAVVETIDFLVKEKGLTPAKALSLCSIAVDYRVAEVVDNTQVIVASVRKSLFVK